MKVRTVISRALTALGAFTLVGAVAFVGFIAYSSGPGNRTEIDRATPHDVRYVLNWCELGDSRIEAVVHSHVSNRSFTGDHLDAFAIKISRLELSELTQKKDGSFGRWYRGDEIPSVVNDAYAFMASWLREVEWFPTVAALRTADYYVYPWSIHFHCTQPTAVDLIIIRPSDRMIFFFGAKT